MSAGITYHFAFSDIAALLNPETGSGSPGSKSRPRRQKLEDENKRWRFVAKLEDGKGSVSLQEVDSKHPFYASNVGFTQENSSPVVVSR